MFIYSAEPSEIEWLFENELKNIIQSHYIDQTKSFMIEGTLENISVINLYDVEKVTDDDTPFIKIIMDEVNYVA